MYSPKQTKRAVDGGFIELHFYLEVYYEYVPDPTYESKNGVEIIKEDAVMEGQEIIANMERNERVLTVKQREGLIGQQLEDEYLKDSKLDENARYARMDPNHIEHMEKAKDNLHDFFKIEAP
jgi:hypothetical protein